jgi:hypothetical protein
VSEEVRLYLRLVVHRADGVAHNEAVDPIVLALAQLVRDRWENERKAALARRRGLKIVGEKGP